MKLRWLIALSVLSSAAVLPAQVVLPKILSSHMVVQRDLPVHVWGKAAPGDAVEVRFRGETRTAAANELGRWSVYLSPGAAGGPFEMTVTADAKPVVLSDILVGDVWVASGQSNMEFELRRAKTADVDLPKASDAKIRLLFVAKHAEDYAKDDADTTGWLTSSPETAAGFSAVAWYFAREIAQDQKVPVGVVDATWGGTVAEAWTRLEALGEDASLMPLFITRGKMTDHEADALLEDQRQQKLKAEARATGKPEPQFPWHPWLNMWAPAMLWNGMIAPLTPMPIRGVIWYQGETNSQLERAPLYHRIFPAMIEDWRRQWGVGDFPFLYVQIANFKSTTSEDWPTVREAQRETLKLRNTAMAVTIDIGNPDDVHPTDKQPVGHRLALGARAVAYGEPVEFSGPLFRQATTEGASLRVWFEHAKGLNFAGGKATGFEIAGADGVFEAAEAKIDGATVLVSSPKVAVPLQVRYGWANSPECHLFNGEGLPASPFTSKR